jgi:hypothetical protein
MLQSQDPSPEDPGIQQSQPQPYHTRSHSSLAPSSHVPTPDRARGGHAGALAIVPEIDQVGRTGKGSAPTWSLTSAILGMSCVYHASAACQDASGHDADMMTNVGSAKPMILTPKHLYGLGHPPQPPLPRSCNQHQLYIALAMVIAEGIAQGALTVKARAPAHQSPVHITATNVCAATLSASARDVGVAIVTSTSCPRHFAWQGVGHHCCQTCSHAT